MLIAVLRNAIMLLDKAKIPIFKDSILKVIEEQQNNKIHPKDMLANQEILVKTALQMMQVEISQQKQVDIGRLIKMIEHSDFA